MEKLMLIYLLLACGDAGKDPNDTDGDGFTVEQGDCDDSNPLLYPEDRDGDGFTACGGDCNDNDAYTFPGAAERDDTSSCMRDADEDGYGDANAIVTTRMPVFGLSMRMEMDFRHVVEIVMMPIHSLIQAQGRVSLSPIFVEQMLMEMGMGI
jgi:hypothetical protein